jgi:hypothetical protein
MRRVKQRTEAGCGIACVAMVAGVSYAQAKAAMPEWADRIGTSRKDMRRALAHFGIRTKAPEPIRGRDVRSLPFDAVLLGFSGDHYWMHWMVWDHGRRRPLDPCDPPGPFRCTSFIRVLGRAKRTKQSRRIRRGAGSRPPPTRL